MFGLSVEDVVWVCVIIVVFVDVVNDLKGVIWLNG